MTAILIEGLRRTYGGTRGFFRRQNNAIEALRGISLAVEQGELFGLLGPNGAGKTTTIKILVTLLTPSAGSARVMGLDVVADVRALRPRIGFTFGGDRGLYDRLSARDNLRFFADLYGLPSRAQRTRIPYVLGLVGLVGREGDRVEGFSRGMRQRLHIARALLHDPDVIFLDEPTIGVDPVGARQLREVIRGLRSEGKTILLTTHYMLEADELCDRVALIADGRIRAIGAPEELKARVADCSIVEITLRGRAGSYGERLRALPGVNAVGCVQHDDRQVITIQAECSVEFVPIAVRHLGDASVLRIETRTPTLEDAYVALVGDE